MKHIRLTVIFATVFGLITLAHAQGPKKRPPGKAPNIVAELATAPDSALPLLQMFVPGFVVRELPVQLTNQNNIEYAPDGRLFTSGYDGRVHLLRDRDGDGLEEQLTTLWNQTSGDYSLGMAFHDGSLYILYRNEVVRFRDTDGDGVPETREVAISNWDDPVIDKAKLILHRRVDYGIGLAVAPDGSFYVGMGNAAFRNPYRRDADGVVHYKPEDRRGCILHISADGSKIEHVASGVRYTMSLQFNRDGELFAADQEGATWLPNGNPFDELLHIQKGRHYGFPPRHPQYLPDVIDEPSVFDFGPQHQGICGFRFNESGRGRRRFGPPEWEGDAILMGQSRGKIYRTKLVRTPAGYVAQNHLIGAVQALPVDCAISPQGELLVAAHSGKPDWGTGPQGIGRLFKIKHDAAEIPQPVLVYAASPTETRVEFTAPLDTAAWKGSASRTALRSGRNAIAGNHYEKMRPGYAVVQAQKIERLREHAIEDATLGADRRTLIVTTGPRTEAVRYALSLPQPIRMPTAPAKSHVLPQDPGIELAFDLDGVEVEWTPRAAGGERWTGWLPHFDLRVARGLTVRSATHERLFARMTQSGTLRMRGQLDLSRMLRPEVQLGSTLGYAYPNEKVTVMLSGSGALKLEGVAGAGMSQVDERSVRLSAETKRGDRWIPFEITLETRPGTETGLDVSWFTSEDARPRALQLGRVRLPWAQMPGAIPELREIPEIAGGNWEAGRQLFFGAAACSACHAMRGEGAAFGPDLTNSIHRDYGSLLRDITQPGAMINPDHLGYIVELDDGSSMAASWPAIPRRSSALPTLRGK